MITHPRTQIAACGFKLCLLKSDNDMIMYKLDHLHVFVWVDVAGVSVWFVLAVAAAVAVTKTIIF